MLLHVRVVHTDRATADFHPVEDEVVVLSAHKLGVPVIQMRNVFVHRRCKRMVRAAELPRAVGFRAEQRELCYPEEVRGVGYFVACRKYFEYFHSSKRCGEMRQTFVQCGLEKGETLFSKDRCAALGDVNAIRNLGYRRTY